MDPGRLTQVLVHRVDRPAGDQPRFVSSSVWTTSPTLWSPVAYRQSITTWELSALRSTRTPRNDRPARGPGSKGWSGEPNAASQTCGFVEERRAVGVEGVLLGDGPLVGGGRPGADHLPRDRRARAGAFVERDAMRRILGRWREGVGGRRVVDRRRRTAGSQPQQPVEGASIRKPDEVGSGSRKVPAGWGTVNIGFVTGFMRRGCAGWSAAVDGGWAARPGDCARTARGRWDAGTPRKTPTACVQSPTDGDSLPTENVQPPTVGDCSPTENVQRPAAGVRPPIAGVSSTMSRVRTILNQRS